MPAVIKATDIPFTTAPTSAFVLAVVGGVLRLRQCLPENLPSSADVVANEALANAATAQNTANTANTTANTAITNAATAQATATAATSTHSTLTYAATTNIDLSAADYRTLTLAGNVTFTTSNRAAPRTVSIKIICDGSNRNFVFPAWVFVGAAAPASITAAKRAILTITAFGTNDTDIMAAYSVEP